MSARWTVQSCGALSEVEPAAWNALVGPDDPFAEHAFLHALERAGCVGGESGWMPAHLLVWREDDDGSRTLDGAAPLYVKDNSYGEYIFDWGWANAAQRGGLRYYPKLVSSVPFTPATGTRVMVAPNADRSAITNLLAQGARAVADAVEASGVHWLFTPEDQASDLTEHGYVHRLSHQYHWENHGWSSFDDYLGAMNAKRRKEVRRERKQAASCGLQLSVEPITALSDADIEALHRCYQSTINERWAIAYLSRDWFFALRSELAHSAHVATARRDGVLVAGALAFQRGKHLYGRYWGATEGVRGLHFELCYYQLIQFALERGLTRFEAGAQGAHKISRGFLPTLTHSAHWLRHPGLFRAVEDFIVREAEHVKAEVASLSERSPFRESVSS